jgi:hypothetical protein
MVTPRPATVASDRIEIEPSDDNFGKILKKL